jgi:hypothetical protein
MPILIHQARELCTKREFELYFGSRAGEITRLTQAKLRSKVSQARTLRDKFRGLAKRQEREARRKQAPRKRRRSEGSLRTRRKEQLFDEVMVRYLKRLESLVDAERRAEDRKRVAAVRKKLATKKTAKKKQSTKTPPQTRGARPAKTGAKMPERHKAETSAKEKRFTRGGLKRIHKHIQATGRRRQARRDARKR